ncbi:hypothetical protein BS78_05G080700 [Paspalum vaginatum]|nr:hypothetical protein BS78_05G080700 [Paspalum vaginatum]
MITLDDGMWFCPKLSGLIEYLSIVQLRFARQNHLTIGEYLNLMMDNIDEVADKRLLALKEIERDKLIVAKGYNKKLKLPFMGTPVLAQGKGTMPTTNADQLELEMKRCKHIHDVVSFEEWRHARQPPCQRCDLNHEEYRVTAMIYDFDEFDCELLFPNINDLKMDGNRVLLPHFLKVRYHAEDSKEVRFIVDSLASDTKVLDSQNFVAIVEVNNSNGSFL